MKSGLSIFLILLSASLLISCKAEKEPDKPNVVIIFLDDSGWADFEPFGEPALETPQVMQLAAEGTAFHNFYVPQAVCSALPTHRGKGGHPCRSQALAVAVPREPVF